MKQPDCKCGKPAAPGRKLCHACAMRRWRQNNPIKAAYFTLRDNAIRRGKDFSLTFAQFRKFCRGSGYLEGKGRKPECLSIDRIDNSRGYEKGNLAVLTVSMNASKGAYERWDMPWNPPKVNEVVPF